MNNHDREMSHDDTHAPTSNPVEYKIFNDSIHGHIEIHPLCVKIIDTPQFQRLRAIKQVGGCYWVFPGASNNRFEHSIGVGHLGGQMARHLQSKQPELNVTDLDVLCVEIAGLCHDLGHGPFSHLFDRHFIPNVIPKSTWTHEKGSIDMLRFMLKDDPDLQKMFTRYGIDDVNLMFVCEMIAGPLCEVPGEDTSALHSAPKLWVRNGSIQMNAASQDLPSKKFRRNSSFNAYTCTHAHPEGWKYRGRDKDKSFLYEIIANHKCGVDVDKWDYFARDCHHLGIRNNFDYSRLIKFNRVNRDEDDLLTICFRDKEAKNLYDMFYTRDTLHRKAYQHRVSNIIEAMITEALTKANDYLLFPGTDGKMLKMTEAIYDMKAYTKLTDYVYHQILNSTLPELEPSRYLLQRIEKRHLFKYIGEIRSSHPFEISAPIVSDIKIQIIQSAIFLNESASPVISVNDLIIQIISFDYGMEDKNPLENVRFYAKESCSEAKKIKKSDVSSMLPDQFVERYLRIYYKREDVDHLSFVANGFKQWCKVQTIFPSQASTFTATCDENPLTPVKNLTVTNRGINDTKFKSDKVRGKALHF